MTTRLAVACRQPFSNGTESASWQENWCNHCAHDHDMHNADGEGPGCTLPFYWILGDLPYPECWMPEPDDGHFHLPSRLTCQQYAPCVACEGDPFAEMRAEQFLEVSAYWRRHGAEQGES